MHFFLFFLFLIEVSFLLLYGFDLILFVIVYLYCGGMLFGFWKLALFVVPCVSGFIEFYYLFLFPDSEGVSGLFWLLFH